MQKINCSCDQIVSDKILGNKGKKNKQKMKGENSKSEIMQCMTNYTSQAGQKIVLET